jgi:hypothetical protein
MHYSTPIAQPPCSPDLTVSIFFSGGVRKEQVMRSAIKRYRSPKSKDFKSFDMSRQKCRTHVRRSDVPFELCSVPVAAHIDPNFPDQYLTFVMAIGAKYLIMNLTVAISQHVYFFHSQTEQLE